ncbi:hypothetical protein QAD02_009675 [Eretmocerus hayati]|uniref:Uncharacterized protein n=1 Tax=Eretmocerus hayati TaxID=131215 RepID=A0ACC2NA20_9HYME|nr:hypothetical protein QAD02_009675 [Eretmocerus hayati]
MFVYLSKKIAIPNNVRLNCIAWNESQGYIAIGGEEGLLKVIKADSSVSTVDTVNANVKNRSMPPSSNLSMNQTLEGHNGHVQVVTWNEVHQKLTSSDQNGVIIVWMLHKGSWYEEMINNRNKSVVKGMSWSSNGQKICIVYEDGAVIVGSVEGSRIWGKELKQISLTAVQWSPDAKLLLFGCRNGEAHLYDDQGNYLTKLDSISSDTYEPIVAIHWYDGRNGYNAVDCPTLAVCFQNGKLYLLRDAFDENSIKVSTGMSIACCVWNTYGSLLAISGLLNGVDKRDSNVVCFYSSCGELLRTLKIPGREVSCCSWEGGSLRISLSVDSNIYFANIRPKYKWAYFGNTVVFTDERVGKDGVCITFWNTVTNARYFKYVHCLMNIAAYGEHCVLAARNDPAQGQERFVLFVCNAISTPIDTKFLDIEPTRIVMNSSVVFVASKNSIVLWNFRNPRNSSLNASRPRRDRVYHVDDTPTGAPDMLQDPDKEKSIESSIERKNSADPICSISATDKILLVGRESGMIQQYSLPQVTLTKRYSSARSPWKLSINCDSTRAAVIDLQGVLRLLELSGIPRDRNDNPSDVPDVEVDKEEDMSRFERKDAWAVCWAQDNPRLLAILEKSRMYIFRGLEPEEPITCSGYVCSFNDLEIRCVLLDELVRQPDAIRPELLLNLEVKSLRDTKDLLSRVGLREAEEFVRDNPHPRLWRLLGEHALRKLELDAAENAMVRCADYLGIRFIKRLQGIHEPGLRRAEVLAFLGDYDEAEKVYLELDRRDLAVALRQKLADFPRALQLMQIGGGVSNDAQLEKAHVRLGEQLAAKGDWRAAREHLERGRELDRLLDCHYHLEEYEQLAATAAQLADQSPALRKAARMLASVGMCEQAVACYVRCADVRQAVETCIRSNRWGQALELARAWRLPGIGELLGKYARHLLTSGRRLQAIELYRKAECPLEAAKLLLELAAEQAQQRRASPLRLKKLYVLAALMVQEYLDGASQQRQQDRSGLLMGLKEASGEDLRVVEEAWRGAEAYHFLLLAHRQLYAGESEAAMRTALRLREYEGLLDQEVVYALLAVASCACRSLATCSRAFVRLESIDSRYEQLALDIFAKRPPKDARPAPKVECTQCETLVPDYFVACPNCATSFPPCVVSGRPLVDLTTAWLCMVCKHRAASERDVVNVNGCPLCHSIITYM